MSKKKKWLLAVDFLLMLLLLVIDQFTKYLAVERLQGKPAFVLIDEVLELDYLENRGAAFGMLQNQKFFLVAVGVVFLLVISWLLWKLPDHKKYLPLHFLAVMIMAGGLGNMIDRIRLDYVVDFISFVLINYPIFNVADIFVVVATIGVVILLLFVYRDEDLPDIAFFRKRDAK